VGGLCETPRVTYKVDGLDEISEEIARLFSYHETCYGYAKIYKRRFNAFIVERIFFAYANYTQKCINIYKEK